MYISSLQLNNYKSYFRTESLILTQGFNIITGQNNVGKTALLEALSFQFVGRPHRSLRTIPTPLSQPNPQTEVNVSITISLEELQEILFVPGDAFNIPLPDPTTVQAREIGYVDDSIASLIALKNWLFFNESFTFELRFTCPYENQPNLSIPQIPSFKMYEPQNGTAPTNSNRRFAQYVVDNDRQLSDGAIIDATENAELGFTVGSNLRARIYIFRAERFNAGTCAFGNNPILAPNAQNLAEVLGILQHNHSRFKEFNNLLHQILPQVQTVSVRPFQNVGNMLEIVVWNHDPKTQRADLAVPLSESGTGVGQVLAILYVVLTSDFPRTIIIDEPQSFLHRGAARKLMEILKYRPQHQYIIATHSPTIITAANPATIAMVKQREGESVVNALDPTEVEQQRLYLAEIGARPQDVFGYDNILWVEGETEEICFPLILERVGKGSLMGTAIKGVSHTGDLEGRHAALVFDLYDRLSHGKSLLPPAIGFILDDECRTAPQKEELRHRSHNLVVFTTRRMYENYLLNPDAIAAVINNAMVVSVNYQGTPVTTEEVSQLLATKSKELKYFKLAEGKVGANDWLYYIHAGSVLEDIFSELSRDRAPITFNKTTHSVALTEWIIKNSPNEFLDLAELIKKILYPES
jgi:energy-coupling factor transporter ATP-binding protein EcfA2